MDKSSALGVCAAIGSSTQLLQPPVGAAADACGGRYRRAWLAVGQGICAAGCVWLYFSQSTQGLSVGFAVTMHANFADVRGYRTFGDAFFTMFEAALGQFNAWNLQWRGEYGNWGEPMGRSELSGEAHDMREPVHMGASLMVVFLLLATVLVDEA